MVGEADGPDLFRALVALRLHNELRLQNEVAKKFNLTSQT